MPGTMTKRDLREGLFAAVLSDLLGPAGGDEEELVCSTVHDRYLIGQLAPGGQWIVACETDELGGHGADSKEEAGGEKDSAPVSSLMPSSLGLTFSVSGAANSVTVEARWGAYFRTKRDVRETPSRESLSVWKRTPRGGRYDLPP